MPSPLSPFRASHPAFVISQLVASSSSSTPLLPHNTTTAFEMAAHFSVARAARQLSSSAARRPSAFVCQRWQRPAIVERRLFSGSAAGQNFEM